MTKATDLKANFEQQGYSAQRGFVGGEALAELQAETARFINDAFITNKR